MKSTPSYNQEKTWFYKILPYLLILGTVFVVYSNTFQSPFVLDDSHNITDNPHVHINDLSFSALKEAAIQSPSYRRWVPNISFALNYYFQELNMWGYHLVNIIIHILCGFSIYILASWTLSNSTHIKQNRFTNEIALASALLWALHPVQTNAVTYIVQRMTSMETLFFILSMLCYVYGRKKQQTFAKRFLLFLMCLLFGLMAILSKENAAMLPFMIIGYEIFFLQEVNFSHNLKKIVLFIVAPVSSIILFGYIFSRGNFFGMFNYSLREFSLTERLLTEPRVIFHYISLLLFPLPQRLNLDYDFIVSPSIFSPPQTILALIGISLLCFVPVIYFRKNRLFAFAVFWFLGNLFIESSFIPLEIIFEHRLYLPSIFLFMAFAASIYYSPFLKLKNARIILIVISIILGVFTWQRNMTWRTPISLWEDIVSKSPNKGRGYLSLALAYSKIGKIDEGIDYYKKALTLLVMPYDSGTIVRVYINMGFSYLIKGQYSEVLKISTNALQINPNDPQIHFNLAIACKKMNLDELAEYHFQYARMLNK